MEVVARNGMRRMGSSTLRGTKYIDALHTLRWPANLQRAHTTSYAHKAAGRSHPHSRCVLYVYGESSTNGSSTKTVSLVLHLVAVQRAHRMPLLI